MAGAAGERHAERRAGQTAEVIVIDEATDPTDGPPQAERGDQVVGVRCETARSATQQQPADQRRAGDGPQRADAARGGRERAPPAGEELGGAIEHDVGDVPGEEAERDHGAERVDGTANRQPEPARPDPRGDDRSRRARDGEEHAHRELERSELQDHLREGMRCARGGSTFSAGHNCGSRRRDPCMRPTVPRYAARVTEWAKAFACTLVLETPVYLFGLSRVTAKPRALRTALRFAGIALLVNLVTPPARLGAHARLVVASLCGRRGPVSGSRNRFCSSRSFGPPAQVALAAVAFTANALSAGVGLLLFP